MGNPDAKEVHPKVDNLFLDCGARNRKDIEGLGIHPGSSLPTRMVLMNWPL
jgi:putative aminopeptidase FrvX